jgi:hypothetical protein
MMFAINTLFFLILNLSFTIIGNELNQNSQLIKLNHELKKLPFANKKLAKDISDKLAQPEFSTRISNTDEESYRQTFCGLLTQSEDLLFNTNLKLQQAKKLLSDTQQNSNCNNESSDTKELRRKVGLLQLRYDELNNIFSTALTHPNVQKQFHPDVIKFTQGWILQKSNLTKSFADFSVKVRRKEAFSPIDADPHKKTLMILTHGTFGKKTMSFYDGFNLDNQNFRHIKHFASWYADLHKTNLDLVSFKWTGSLFDTPRFAAAGKLEEYVSQNYAGVPLVLMAHSHGCNVHNSFSQITKNPIELMVHLACPKREPWEEDKYHPMQFKNLIYFHAKSDAVEPLGRINLKKVGLIAGAGTLALTAYMLDYNRIYREKVFAFQRLFPNIEYIDKLIEEGKFDEWHNVRLKAWKEAALIYPKEYEEVKFYELARKNPVPRFPLKVGSGIATVAASHQISSTLTKYNYFAPQDDAIVIGLKTKINRSTLGHSEVIDVVKYLPTIMEHISTHHGSEALKSFKADLNIQDPAFNKRYGDATSLMAINIANVKTESGKHILPKELPLHLKQKQSVDAID